MKKLKKIFGWLTVLLAVLMVACFLVGPIVTCIQEETPDQIVKSVVEVVMPGGKFGGPLFDFETIFAFSPELIVQSILGILGLFLLVCVAVNLLAWIVLAIVMKRARQIWLAILFTIVVAIPAYLVAMNTMGIVESFTTVIGLVQGGALDTTVLFENILPLAGLLIGYLTLLFGLAAFVFNILFLIFNRKAVIVRQERERRELYARHKTFIKGFRDRVDEAEKAFDELKEFVAADKGHALYLRPDLKEATKNLKEARKALKKAEAKYKSEKVSRKPKTAKDLAYEKKIAERDARRAKAEKEAAARRAKALEERKAKEAAAKRARAKAEKEAVERRAAELEARKAREAKERKLAEARRAEALKEREAREAAAKRARAKAEKEAAERRAKVLEERKVREEIARKQAELKRAKALEERKLREEIAKKQDEIRRAKALEERKLREEAAKRARAKALKEKEEKKQQEAELRAAIKKVEEEFRAKHNGEVVVAPVKKAPTKKAHKKAHKKVTKKVVAPAPVVVKAPVKKAPAKKPVAKKAPVKKAPAKKPAVKKVVAPVAKAKVAAPAVKMTFAKRIASADKSLKDAYNEIKSEIMSYGVNSRVASAGDTFRLHTKTYVKMVVAGKSLKLYMALNPKDYANSPMPIGDASKKNLYKEIPLVFKVKSDLSLRRAKMLIADTMAKDNLVQGEVQKRDWIKEL